MWMKMPKRCLAWVLPMSAVLLAACAANRPNPGSGAVQPAYFSPPDMALGSGVYGYSQAVRVGPWVMVSGQVGYDTTRRVYATSLEDQAAWAFKNLAAVLKNAGATMDDVVSITTWQTDMSQFNAVVYARDQAFGEHRPAWTAVGVNALAMPQLQFQVSALAYSPRSGKQ